MKREQDPFVERVRKLEERLFGAALSGGSRIGSDGREFWHFRPSHHAATGLLTAEDIALLSEPGRRLLSVGAYPAFLERLLLELGVPGENILLADSDPAIESVAGTIPSAIFDACEPWPDVGTFDRIIFPESLAIALSDRMRENASRDLQQKDKFEAALLADILRQALARLRPGGIIRANGPMSHPNVLRTMTATLQEEGLKIEIESQRFFLALRNEEN